MPKSTEVTMVTMTGLRRELAALADKAARGETVVITKAGIPYLQLIAVRHEYQTPLAATVDVPDLATSTMEELVAKLTQARADKDETLALAILAELGERAVRAATFTHMQQE
jgi:antitoxin (DNA-binding transcriptional repressor) of toxin-antitoxin stability system